MDKPVATPLPPLGPCDFLDEAQSEILWALMDGALPSITSASSVTDAASQISLPDSEFEQVVNTIAQSMKKGSVQRDAIVEYLNYRPSQDPRFREDILRTLSLSPGRHELAKALGSMTTHMGSLFMTGYWSPISQQPTAVREAILKSWATSRLLSFRNLAKTMSSLAQKGDCMVSPYFDRLFGYTDVPKDWKAGLGYDYKFLQFPPNDEPQVLTTDIVIVGSGYGGSVCAKNLAEAGHNVLVVDKGYYFPPSQLPMTQASATQYLFDQGGIYMTEKAGYANLTAGSAWGGSGTVNWSVCLKAQDYVRAEWASTGLPVFTSKQFDEAMDRVWDFVGAGTAGVRHNHRNQVLLDGCKSLGWKVDIAAQNTAGADHQCGHCHLGCGSSGKRGPAVSWLPAAGEAGAEFIEGFQVDRVLFDEDGVTAIGVEGLWTSRGPNGEVHLPESERVQRRVIVKASKVIVSAGSLWSPLILMRSGVENPHLGHNLHIHPVNIVTAVYEEDHHPWEGSAITSYSSEFENLDEKGYGVKLEPISMLPYLILAMQPWTSSLQAKLQTLKYPRMAAYISLTRDRDGGNVFPDPVTGSPRINYEVSDYDRAHTIEGVIALSKICYVTGATEIQPVISGLAPFIPDRDAVSKLGQHPSGDPEFTDAAFAKWLKELRRIGNAPPLTTWSSAHIMGSCRMSAQEAGGVVDGKGRVWGKKNLIVADASVFPGAVGVNPMMTVMAISDCISQGVLEEWRC